MAADPTPRAPLDWNVLRRIADDVGADDVDEVLTAFARDIRAQAEAIPRGVERAALNEIEFRAHRLSANAGAVGGRELAATARSIEERARAGDIEAVRRLVPGLRERAHAALAELERFQRVFPG